MLGPGKVIAALLALALAGCATYPGRQSEQATQKPPDSPAEVSSPEVQPAEPAVSEPVLTTPPLVVAPPTVDSKPIPPVQPAPKVNPTKGFRETWVGLSRWCKANDLAAPMRITNASSPTYVVSSKNGSLVVKPWSHQAHWNGAELRLGFAPQLMNGEPVCHILDLEKNLRPLLVNESIDPVTPAQTAEHEQLPVIVIDPGHGGENAGTKSVLGARYEKEFTLDWARRLSTLLSAKGWQVFLTRTNDTDLALSNRVAVAEKHNAALFLSLHFNSSAPNETQAGLETYCLTPTGMASTVTRQFEDDAASVFPNNSFDARNLQLAVKIHSALLKVNGHHDRGLRRARYLGVLRGQQRPAVLVEGGYLSNPREARLIAEPSYREKLAEAIANALTEGAEPRSKPVITVSSATAATAKEAPSRADAKPPTGQTAVILPNLPLR